MKTLGNTFKNICFVGLERVEYFPQGEETSIFAETWQEVTSEQSRKHLSLCFFAPRSIDGEHINPYQYILKEEIDEDDHKAMQIAAQTFGDMPLLDLCRMKSREANEVNILVAADVIFHWDMNDSYIQPTTPLTWVRDLQQIFKSYPRTSQKNIYTNWDREKIAELDANVKPALEMPLETATWLNMPTFQEKYGMLVLLASLIMAGTAFAMTFWQNQQISHYTTQARRIESAMPRGGNVPEMLRAVNEQQRQMQYRDLLPLLAQDVAIATQQASMQVESIEVRNVNPQEPPQAMLATISAERDVYKGWLQEEPIAKNVLAKSSTLRGIRKPPGPDFKLEGLVDLRLLREQIRLYEEDQRIQDAIQGGQR